MRRRTSAIHRDRKGPCRFSADAGGTERSAPAPLAPCVQSHIGNLLKVMYNSALDEPVPARFLELLRQLDGKTGIDGGSTPTPDVTGDSLK
jgi:hypothetical protein